MPESVHSPPSRICFREFQLDTASGELHKNGQTIALPPKVFGLLLALVDHPDEVVTREELRTKLWAADTFVEFDDSLNHAVKKLRQALGDSADNPRFIETLPRYGYRFIAPVEVEQPSVTKSTPEPRQDRTIVAAVALATALVAVSVLFFWNPGNWRSHLAARVGHPEIRALAVLPLANLSGDPQEEYFADGMTDALITDLAKLHEVKVISRTSVMRFKEVKKPLAEIAQSLGVDGILEGTVQRSAGRLRITLQLVRAPADEHVWAQSYERDTRDILALQSEIAQAVAHEIKIALTSEESASLARPRSVNPEAYEAYLKGLSHWYRISPEHLAAALEYFQLALEKDPNYALAYVGVANVWLLRSDAGFMLPAEAYPKSKAAIARALELDNSVSEAHITYANIVGPYDRDWAAAEREYRHGVELNPNNADGHFMYSDFLISMKRTEEWDREVRRTLELDPFNPFFQCFYGWHLIYLGRYNEAIAQLQKVLATEPDFSSAHMGLWGAYYKKKMYSEALSEAKAFYGALHDEEVESVLARVAPQGYSAAMHAAADVLAVRSRTKHVPAVRIARLYAHAGDAEDALRWLERAHEQRETPLTHLAVAWDWEVLRDDVRFQDLVRRSGLEN
jgi:TolB-like protein/DNA-binding winged helix-turn-helix (wHTH) protein/Tfp pilus assembly protein PilF